MLILSRSRWTIGDDGGSLAARLRATLDLADPGGGNVVLLPVADDAPTAPSEQEFRRRLTDLSQELKIFLAAAAVIRDGDETRQAGFVVDPDGEALLAAAKTLPDLGVGFADETTRLYQPREFDAAATPVGKVALILGEDILSPHMVRACAFAGAEIVLNPTRERSDAYTEVRQAARAARAYENIMYVASTSACASGGELTTLADTTGLFDFNGKAFLNDGGAAAFYADIDLEELRRRRREPFANFLAVHRSSLYARDYGQPRESASPAPSTRAQWQREGTRRAASKAAVEEDAPCYDAAAIQTLLRNVPDVEHKDEVVQANLADSLAIADKWAMQPNVRLVVFPEFWMQGVHFQRSLEDWTKVAVTMPGREIDQLGEFAQARKCYVAGAAFEFDPDWPDRWFNTAFIINDSGDLIHRYRKIQCADTSGLMNNSTPGNLLSAYLDRYGYEFLFPVADTPLGKLATIICFDMNFPETTRAMVRRGAEVIIHPTAEPHNTRRRGWDKARRARAFENTAYVISAAIGGEYRRHNDVKPEFFHRGYSKIVKFDGTIDAVVDGPGEVPLVSRIDLGALRRARANPLINLELWDEPGVYGHAYASHEGFPEDVWLEKPMQSAREGFEQTKRVIARYTETRVFEPA